VHHVRSILGEQTPLAQGLTNKRNVSLRKISDAAMNKLRGFTRSTLREISRFEQQRAISTGRRIDCGA
jgi:hypothetical protein